VTVLTKSSSFIAKPYYKLTENKQIMLHHRFNYMYIYFIQATMKSQMICTHSRNAANVSNSQPVKPALKTEPDIPQWQKLERLWAVQAETGSMWNSNARRQATTSDVDRSHSHHSPPTSRDYVTPRAASDTQHWQAIPTMTINMETWHK